MSLKSLSASKDVWTLIRSIESSVHSLELTYEVKH